MARDSLLFDDGRLADVLEAHARTMDAEIANAPEEHLMQADEDEWVAALVDRYQVQAPTLHRDKWSMEPLEEIKIDPYGGGTHVYLDYGRPVYLDGFRATIQVPFSGDANVFKVTPSTFNWNPPTARIGKNEIQIVIEYPADAPKNVRAEADSILDNIDKFLAWAQTDVEAFNKSLAERARLAIQTRRGRVQRAYEDVRKAGIPMKSTGEQPQTYIADVLVRRPSPSRPPSVSTPIELQPVLSDAVFDHILEVIRGATEAMERSPNTYATMGEEDRRHVLLTALNTHYRGQVTAEAFNITGKTDILVRHPEGRNLFIGECKFWEGVKAFSATIGQLFGYRGWRDTKLAIVMFVREKNLTSIVEKARETLAAHPQFVKWLDAAGETEFRAVMSWPGDESQHADLNVFLVHTPE